MKRKKIVFMGMLKLLAHLVRYNTNYLMYSTLLGGVREVCLCIKSLPFMDYTVHPQV